MTKEEILSKHFANSTDKGTPEWIYEAMQEYADQETRIALDGQWESEYGTNGSGTPLTPEEAKKFWDELPSQLIEKYSDKNLDYLTKYLNQKPILP